VKIAIVASALLWTTCCLGSGRLEGTVRDSSEAVVPHTLILCIGAETGFRFSTESDQNGNYAFMVPDGSYNLIVRQNGFRPIVRVRVIVPGGGVLRVDFELRPNTIRQEMTVSDFLDKDGAAAEPGSTVLTGSWSCLHSCQSWGAGAIIELGCTPEYQRILGRWRQRE
jgi:hypothetical protein